MNNEELAKTVELAKKKDKEALSELYSETHNAAYFTAISILKNEQDALDAVQDSYITAYTGLNQLEDNAAFIGWLKRIVANKCKDMLKRKKPTLFNSDEEENDTLQNIEEQSEAFLPQDYIDQTAKREQIMQIINQLSDVQKTTILLFYYNELSIAEIAQTMECSESTVTSRISYAKKYIKQEVEKLEKKGDKLYTVAPIPFLMKLFKEEAKAHPMSDAAAKAVLNNTLAATTGTAVTVGATTGLIAKFTAMSTAAKCILAGVAAIVVVAGISVPIILANQNKAEQTAAVASNQSGEETFEGTYRASDGGTLTITDLGNREDGNDFKFILEGKVYNDVCGGAWCRGARINRSSDGKIIFDQSQYTYGFTDTDGQCAVSLVGTEQGYLLRSKDSKDTSFYLVKENKKKEDTSDGYYDIIKVYKKVSNTVSSISNKNTPTSGDTSSSKTPDNSDSIEGTYRAADGGILKISAVGDDKYDFNLEGKTYNKAYSIGNHYCYSADKKIEFGVMQYGYNSGDFTLIGTEQAYLLKNLNTSDTSFYLVKKSGKTVSDDPYSDLLDIIKIYKKVNQ